MATYPTAYRAGSRAYAGTPAFNRVPAGGSAVPSARVRSPQSPVPDLFDQLVEALIAEETGWSGLLEDAISSNRVGPWDIGRPGGPPMTPSSPFPGVSKGAFQGAMRVAGRFTPFLNYYYWARDLYQLAQWIYERMKLTNPTGPTGGGDCYAPCGSANIVTWTSHDRCFYSACSFNERFLYGLERPTPTSNTALYFASHPATPPSTGIWYDRVRVYQWANATDVEAWPLYYGLAEPLPITYPFMPDLLPILKPVADPQPLPYRARPYQTSQYHVTGPRPRRERQVVTLPNPVGAGGRDLEPPYTTRHAPPPPRTRDRKYGGKGQLRVWMAIGAATEVDEMLECAWKSIPLKLRKPIYGRKVHGQTMYYWNKYYAKSHGISEEDRADHNRRFKLGKPVHQTPQNMVDDIVNHYDEMDRRKFEDCFLENAVMDAAIGIPSILALKYYREFEKSIGVSHKWLHLGTGPAL